MDIANLSWQNIILSLQVEAGLLGSGEMELDVGHAARFAHLLEIVTEAGTPLDQRSIALIDRAAAKLSTDRPDILHKWQTYQQGHMVRPFIQPSYSPMPSPAGPTPAPYSESFDPYAASTDFKGSAVIVEELESRRNAASSST